MSATSTASRMSLLRSPIVWSSGLVLAVVCFGLGYAVNQIPGRSDNASEKLEQEKEIQIVPASEITEGDQAQEVPVVVQLSEEKRKRANIKMAPVTKGPLHTSHAITARLRFNPSKQWHLRAPLSGIVVAMPKELGAMVQGNEIVVEIESPELLRVENELSAAAQKLEIAKVALKWHEEVSVNLTQMLARIEAKEEVTKIEGEFLGKSLGKSRSTILTAYSRSLLAQRMKDRGEQAAQGGAVSGRVVDERQSELIETRSELLAACEQASFEQSQTTAKAKLDVDDATREVNAVLKKLDSLTGLASSTLANDPKYSTIQEKPSTVDANPLRCVSPVEGTLIERNVTLGERVDLNQTLLCVGDLTELWVVAELRPQDWGLLPTIASSNLLVEVVGMSNGTKVAAKWHHMAGEVNKETGAIELVASIANPDLVLRPGMFVRLHVEIPSQRDVIAIPETAIFTHDSRQMVFIEQADGFRVQYIKVGLKHDGLCEVIEGLTEKDSVVIDGVFDLASESLLEKEE